MKDNEKQIEELKELTELATVISGTTELDTKTYYKVLPKAKKIIALGYRKFPKDSVVLSREEYHDLLNKDFTCFVGGQHKTDHCLYLEEAQKASKETAEKFVEKLENGIDNLDIILHEDNDEQYVSINQLLEFIDEIEKQFGVEVDG